MTDQVPLNAMLQKHLLIFSLFIFYAVNIFSQSCSTLGQTPSTAFPICGTSSFNQNTVPACGGNRIPAPCSSNPVADKNPFWYKFTCYTSGTLGFLITPNDINDDYDWQLFDITNHNANEVYNNGSLFVSCNWSGETGLTGASSQGTTLNVCPSYTGGPYQPLFSSMPNIIQGHNYILLISHFTATSQSGYSLDFIGGTASITDPLLPHLQNAYANSCDAKTIIVTLNKHIKCNSLAADGSDFTITPSLTSIVSARGINCSNSFDMDSIEITFNQSLPPNQYKLSVKTGNDANTLLDNCDRPIPVGENILLNIPVIAPTSLDSISPAGCSPSSLQLIFKKKIACNSISSNGSDFIISGPYPNSITSANGICDNNGLTQSINLTLSSPIKNKGTFKITLQKGNDGNTIVDECGLATPVQSSISFNTEDTVSAAFNFNIKFTCTTDTIHYNNSGGNDINSWLWTFDDTLQSTIQNPIIIYKTFGQKNAKLIVTNGVCSDTSFSNNTLNLSNTLKAQFEYSEFICPNELGIFKDASIGNISEWNWDFGNGNTSPLQNPPTQTYTVPSTPTNYTVQLIVKNNLGCYDTATNIVNVLNNCYIAVPSAFTPNGDGLNDYLYPLNAYKAINLHFIVFNRYGQKVFETTDWTKKWDGSFNGTPQQPGAYVWMLEYTEVDTNIKKFLKGSSVLIR